MLTMPKRSNSSRNPIENSINMARTWMMSRMHSEGWFPFAQIQEKSIRGSWCTAQATTALILAGGKDIIPNLKKTVSWLAGQRIGKGWGTMVVGEPMIESTTWVLLALLHAQKNGLTSAMVDTNIEDGISWLLDCQNPDGGWGSWKDDVSRTTTSSLACEVLMQRGSCEKVLGRAKGFLKDSQNEDGGWGFREGEKSNIIGSSLALSALSRSSVDKNAIELGCEFLKSEQNADGAFAESLFIHETIGREDGILRWQYFHLPYTVYSLAISGRTGSIALFRGLSKMLGLQEISGAWVNPSEPQVCYHTYVTLYYLAKTVGLLDKKHFLEFWRIMEENKKQERKYRILAQKNQLHQEIIQRALIIGKEFELAAGGKSSYYYDLKELVLDPKVVNIVANLIWEMSADIQADAIGGPETGAIPIAIAVAEKSLKSEIPLRAFFIRKEPKGYGTKAFIEGPLRKGDHVILVEDVTTTGASVNKSIEKVLEMGCKVVRIYSIVDREEGTLKNLGEYASVFHSLFKHSEVKGLVDGF